MTFATGIVRCNRLAFLRGRSALSGIAATVGAAMTMVMTRTALIRAAAGPPHLNQRRFGGRSFSCRLIGIGFRCRRFSRHRFRRGIRCNNSVSARLNRRCMHRSFRLRRVRRLIGRRNEIDPRQFRRAGCVLGDHSAFVGSG